MKIINLMWLLFAHYILDYPLQGDFLAKTKGENFYSLFVHSTIYSLGICLTSFYTLTNINKLELTITWMVIMLTHMTIDFIKANATDKTKALTTYLYMDQLAHNLINFIIFFVLNNI